MKKSQVRRLWNNYPPRLLTAVIILISFFANGQAVYNPAQQPGFTFVINKPLGQSGPFGLDARSKKADTVNGLYRAYNGTSEVLTYLNTPASRSGQFTIFVNVGGSLQSNGQFIGGQIFPYWFLRGVADSQLVFMNTNGSSGGAFFAIANNLSEGTPSVMRNNLGLGTMAAQSTTAGGTNLSGTWPDPLVVRFNGQLPSYYLNYLNLTNQPAIPAQINITDAGLFTHSGVYPNYTFNVVTPGIQAVITANNALSGDNTINTGVFNLILGGTSAFGLPSGTTAQRPSSPSAGWVRWNTDSLKKETFNGSIWVSDGTGGSGPGSGITALTGDGTASGTGSVPFTLATVNSNVFGSNTFLKFGVNGKGLTTSATAVLGSDITGALGFTPYNATNPSGYIPLTALSGTGYILYDNTTGVIKADTSAGKLASQTYVNSRGFITLDSALINQYGLLQTLVGSGKYWRLDSATVFPQIRATIPSGLQTLTYAQNALNNTLSISSGNTQTFLIADHTHAGLLDSGRANSIDSLRLGLKTFTLYAVQGLQMVGATGDSIGLGGTPFFQPDTIKTAGQPFLITGLPNKTVGGTDSALIEDANGKVFKALFPTGGGAVASVSNSDGTLTISPTTGAVVASLNLSHANTWAATQTLTLAPIFSSLTGYLKGNGASALTASTTVPTTDLTGTLQAAQEPAHTGDVTNTAGSLALTIATNAVTNAKAAQMGAFTIKANNTAGTANPLDISPAQLLSMTNLQNSLQVVASAYTAKGDLLVGTGASTYTTLSLGADGSVPIADRTQTSGIRWSVQPTIFNVFDYGAYGDGQVVTDMAVVSGTAAIFSTQATFTSGDVGKHFYAKGVGASGRDTIGTITAFTNSHQVTISVNTSTGGGGHVFRWGHSDDTAWQAGLNALYARGGGTLYVPSLPKGRTYVFANALVHSDNLGHDPNCQVYIPSENFISLTNPDSTAYVIKILGEIAPPFSQQGALGNDSTAITSGGTLVCSYLISNYGQGAVIGSAYTVNTGYGNFSATRPILENVYLSVPDGLDGAYRSGIDLLNSIGMQIKNCLVMTDAPCTQKHKSIYPVFGMRFTGINGAESIYLDGFNQNIGFNYGAVASEHTSGQVLSCDCNTVGLLVTATNHALHISTYKSHWNSDDIAFHMYDTISLTNGLSKIQIDQMDMEGINATGRYYSHNHGINDSLNKATGVIGYFFGVASISVAPAPTFNPTTTNIIYPLLGDQLNANVLLAGGASKNSLGTASSINPSSNSVFELYHGGSVSGNTQYAQFVASNNQLSTGSLVGQFIGFNRNLNNVMAELDIFTDDAVNNGYARMSINRGGTFTEYQNWKGLKSTFSVPALLWSRTTTQQNAIASPVAGMLIWNSDTLDIMRYTGSAWLREGGGTGGGGGVTTVGTFSGSSQTNGASISSTTITFGPADATNPGMVTTGSQTIAGIKTFNAAPVLNALNTSISGAKILLHNPDSAVSELGIGAGLSISGGNLVSSGGSTPTLDQVLTAGATLSTTQTIVTSSTNLLKITGMNNSNAGLVVTKAADSSLTEEPRTNYIPSGVAGTVLFKGSSVNSTNTNLFFDNANTRLGIGNAAPSKRLHITSTGNDDMFLIENTTASLYTAATFKTDQTATAEIIKAGSTFTSGAIVANQFIMQNTDNGGILMSVNNAAGNFIITTGGVATTNRRLNILTGGNVLLGNSLTDNAAFLQIPANTTTNASMFFNGFSSDVTSPTNGMLWYNSTAHTLNFRDNGVTTNILAGGATFANPTGTIGLTAVNGSATTAMRSDGAPALSQAITPTWSAKHIFSVSPGLNALNTATTGTILMHLNDSTMGQVGLGSGLSISGGNLNVTGASIYTTDGSLTSNRTLDGSASHFSLILGSVSNNINALTVNAVNNITLGSNSGFILLNSGTAFISSAATDANTTVTTQMHFVKLPVVTANRTLTLPAASTGNLEYYFINQNTSGTFSWTISPSIQDAAGNTISTLVNGTVYHIYSDGTNWIKL